MEAVEKKGIPKAEGTKVFKNPIIEKLTRTHVAVPISILSSFVAWMVYWGIITTPLSILAIIGLFLVGVLAFSLVEYLIHRYFFHMPTTTPSREKMQYNFHGIHHEFPKDKDRLAMPPLVSAAISTGLYFLFVWLMGDMVYGFLPGFLVGYTLYLVVHFIVHAYQPPKNIFKHLWIHHGIHHYKDHERAFGVSSPLWDFIFRTMPVKK